MSSIFSINSGATAPELIENTEEMFASSNLILHTSVLTIATMVKSGLNPFNKGISTWHRHNYVCSTIETFLQYQEVV